MFPTTLANDWCGDYEQKPQVEAPVIVQESKPVNAPSFEPASGFINEIKKRVGRPKKNS